MFYDVFRGDVPTFTRPGPQCDCSRPQDRDVNLSDKKKCGATALVENEKRCNPRHLTAKDHSSGLDIQLLAAGINPHMQVPKESSPIISV